MKLLCGAPCGRRGLASMPHARCQGQNRSCRMLITATFCPTARAHVRFSAPGHGPARGKKAKGPEDRTLCHVFFTPCRTGRHYERKVKARHWIRQLASSSKPADPPQAASPKPQDIGRRDCDSGRAGLRSGIGADQPQTAQIDADPCLQQIFGRKRCRSAGSSAGEQVDNAMAHRPDMGRKHGGRRALFRGDVL